MTALAPRRATTARDVVRAVAVGTLAALVLALLVYAAARLTGDGLAVSVPGRAASAVPLGGVLAATLAASTGALVLALVLRRLAGARAGTVFLGASVVVLLASLASPFAATEATSTALWLCLMHVAVAAGLVPPTLRALRGGAR